MYNDIIPQHLQEELIQIGEDITKHTFRIGDIVLSILDYVGENGFDCTKRDVWRAVGSLIGKSAATIQGYETLASFYPAWIRKKYDILSSSHFRIAMQIDSKTDYTWSNALDYAIDRVEDYGRPATVDELMKVFIYNSNPFEFDEPKIEHTKDDPFNGFVVTFSNLKRYTELLSIPEHTRVELLDAMMTIEEVINSILIEV